MSTQPRITILFDNYPGVPGLRTLWGFAALVRLPDRTILFDTGSNGRVLLVNMAALGIAPESIDLVFLSHPHWDHIGGLDSILELKPDATVVVHEGFSKHLIQDLRGLCRELICVGPEPRELAPGVMSTGMLDSDPPEQAMLIDAAGVTAVLSGCAHPGMDRIVAHARETTGKRIRWAIGGFHLMYANEAEITRSIRALGDLGVEQVLPTHCTGDQAIAAFHRAYGSRCHPGGVGAEIPVGAAVAQ